MENVISNIILAICAVMLAMCFIVMAKNIVTYERRVLIYDAIFRYHINCIRNKENICVDYDDTEDYDKTLWRLHDWGYKNILPPEKFAIIKPFILKK